MADRWSVWATPTRCGRCSGANSASPCASRQKAMIPPPARAGRVSVRANDQPLFEALRAWRSAEAKTQHVPPYVIFHDRTLAEIAQTRPTSRAALAQINGVGEAKLAHYGQAVMAVVEAF